MLGMMGACVETYQYDGRRPTRLSWKTRFYADFWSVKNKRTPSASSSNPVLIAKVAACFVGVLAPGFRDGLFYNFILFYFYQAKTEMASPPIGCIPVGHSDAIPNIGNVMLAKAMDRLRRLLDLCSTVYGGVWTLNLSV